jgi:hypothetical protein
MSACEDRGADLFLMARGSPVAAADLDRHVAGCAACREDLERLRALARDLPAASAGLAPRPATRVTVLGEAGRGIGSHPPGVPQRFRKGRLLRFWIPAGLVAASVAVTMAVLLRDRLAPPVRGVPVSSLWFASPSQTVLNAGFLPGAEIGVECVAGLRFGAPVDAEAVLGAGARLRIPEGRRPDRTLELVSGAAWFDPSPEGSEARPPAASRLVILAGDGVEVEERGARFAVERRAGGAVEVMVEAGVVVVRSGGGETTAGGPCRIAAAPGGKPSAPTPAPAEDATAWFAYPDLSLEVLPGAAPGEQDLVLTVLPAVPRRVRIAPFDPYDPLFSLRCSREDKGLLQVPLRPPMLRRAPPEPDSDGGFLLGPLRPYRIVINPAALGLPRGRVRIEALYSATRPGGLWRGTRASNPVEVDVP